MPGQYHLSVDNAVKMAEEVYKLGIPAVEVFGLPEYKDEIGSSAWDMTSPVQRAIKAIKSAVPDLVIVGDVCLCQYTLSGHCGVLKGHEVDCESRSFPGRSRCRYCSAFRYDGRTYCGHS